MTESDTFLDSMHFLHKAPLLMVLCMAVHAMVSLATAPPDAEKS